MDRQGTTGRLAYAVVGSGLAGVACASELIESGAEVTMFDVGLRCEPERLSRVHRMAHQPPSEWSDSDFACIASPREETLREVPRKLVFGSAFPYVSDGRAEVIQRGTRCAMSWAEGGLSNVWGAAMLPFAERELADWPIDPKDLHSHFAAVGRMVGLSGMRDDLDEAFPWHSEPQPALRQSAQARQLLGRLQSHRDALRRHGLSFGQSRLAVDASTCQLCQRCLTGCVYGSVYASSRTLRRLQSHPRFRYVPGVQVRRYLDRSCDAELSWMTPGQNETGSGVFRRVFIAAGVLGTARIVADSQDEPAIQLSVLHHPYFLLPLLSPHHVGQVQQEALHSLAQIFLVLDDATISNHLIHLQVYTYNPLLQQRLLNLGWIGRPLAQLLLGRLAVLQAYLHSAEGRPMTLVLRKQVGGVSSIELTSHPERQTSSKMRLVVRRLIRLSRLTGMVPIPFAMEAGLPGDGNHIGGTFPMTRSPAGWDSDAVGRVRGARHVHLVDASVLPTIPASTMAYTAMANSRRIAEAARRLDGDGVS